MKRPYRNRPDPTGKEATGFQVFRNMTSEIATKAHQNAMNNETVQQFNALIKPDSSLEEVSAATKGIFQMFAMGNITKMGPSAAKYFAGDDFLNQLRNAKQSASRETIVEMTPRDFLKVAPTTDDLARLQGDYKGIGVMKLVDQGIKWDTIPYLRFQQNSGTVAEVSGHEGRHRMAELVRRGLGDEPIPVRLQSGEAGNASGQWAIRFGENPHRPLVLTQEGAGKGTIDFPKTTLFPGNGKP